MRRFALTHRVPALRDRESAGVDHYRRLFTRHLRERRESDDDLRAAVAAASVVAAHNVALREWLRRGRVAQPAESAAPASSASASGRRDAAAGASPGLTTACADPPRGRLGRLRAPTTTPLTPDVRDPRAAANAQAELDGLGPGDHG